jgi:predicted acyltransferase
MVTSGLASMTLGAVYYIVDVRGYTYGTKPGIIFGANAIAVYFLADVLSYVFYLIPFGCCALNIHFMNLIRETALSPKLASMMFALIFVAVNFIPAYLLYKKKIFIKL